MNEFKNLENIYPPDLPRAIKGWDYITKQYLYYFKHNTPNGIYDFGMTRMVILFMKE